jgi:hypothetical protein
MFWIWRQQWHLGIVINCIIWPLVQLTRQHFFFSWEIFALWWIFFWEKNWTNMFLQCKFVFPFKKESGELVGAIYSTKKSLVCVLIKCFRLEICKKSPQNKITGFNQFFEGKFRQSVKKKNWMFFFLGSQIPYFKKKKSQKTLFYFWNHRKSLQSLAKWA